MKFPHYLKTLVKWIAYSIGFITITVGSFKLVGVNIFNVDVSGLIKNAAMASHTDKTRPLQDGDIVSQTGYFKVALTHNDPDMMPLVGVIDEQFGEEFYSPATVRNGYVYFTLKVGGPDDTNRVFSVRGLLVPQNAPVNIGYGYKQPLAGKELFPRLYVHRP